MFVTDKAELFSWEEVLSHSRAFNLNNTEK
jgi:hypothetical protein